tara:strand:+ start:1114 stop:1989 length:876 start_codon:yes stop_codon:yes gene_type:complete
LRNNILVKKISTLQELKLSMKILVKGFGWSKDYANAMFNNLTSKGNKIDFYGFTLNQKKDGVIGVILTLYQGFVESSGKKIGIINLSGWYVLEEHRGYKSIFFLKQVTKELSEFIITNYSPNNSTKAILKALDFREMKTCTKNFYLYKFSLCILKELFFGNNLISKNKISKCPKRKFINYRDSEYIDLNIKGKIMHLLINESNLYKKIIFLNIKIPRLHILWCSDNEILEENFYLILTLLFLRYKTYVISIHCLELSSIPFQKYWRRHFYKAPIYCDQKPFFAGCEHSVKF